MVTYTARHVHRPGRAHRPEFLGTGDTVRGGKQCQSAHVGAVRCDWGGRGARGAGGVGTLSERVQSALGADPELSLSDLCVRVQSDDTSMVATLARMVRLQAERAKVQAIPQSDRRGAGNSASPSEAVLPVRLIPSGGD